jgi:hypothetical protein
MSLLGMCRLPVNVKITEEQDMNNNSSTVSIATVAGDTAYNGWSNRETWLVSLWLNNDESLYSQLLAAVELNESASIKAEWLAERVQEQLDWYLEDQAASLWVDMLRGSFYRVDWVEIVRANLE